MSRDPRAPAIAVVGSLNIDLIAYASRLPDAGETVLGDRFQMGFGGKGANQAVMAARLGARVWMVGALGDDVYAEMTLENLARQGVETSHVARVPGSSGVAPIWVSADGMNRIIVVPGANGLVDARTARKAVRSIGKVDAVIGQLEIPQLVTGVAFAAARELGAVTILNPAPAATLAGELLSASDWLIPNEVEFAQLTDNESPSESGDGVQSEDQAFVDSAARMDRRLVVTLGSRGAAIVSRGGSVVRVPAGTVTAVDTTGAGDAFVGAFAFGLAAGLAELDAVRLGVACASDSVTRPGTQASFPSPDRARELLAAITGRT
jgi:ribokinase